MAAPSTALVAALAVLVADATIELGFITSMVAYLHAGAPSGTFVVNTPAGAGANPTYLIKGKPLHVVINQGHTSNGAAGSAIVLIGIVGTLALLLRAKAPGSRLGRALYYFWMGLQIPALLLTLVALAYTFAAVHAHRGQTIDQAVAYATQPGPYALDGWTPQNWFAAVLAQLDLADAALRSNLVFHLRIMRGWQYNLIPLFVVQLVETVLAFVDLRIWRANRASFGTGHTPTANEKYYSHGDYNGPDAGVQAFRQPANNNGGQQYAPQQYAQQADRDQQWV